MQLRAQKVSFFSRSVRQMYLKAFPSEERMPFPAMVAMSKLWHTDFLEFYDGDTLCGFVYPAHTRKLVFIMFLAVDKVLRSKGYGSAILHKIQRRYSDTAVSAVALSRRSPCWESAFRSNTDLKKSQNRYSQISTGARSRCERT